MYFVYAIQSLSKKRIYIGQTKDFKKRFFAGIKKLPDDPKAKVYAPSGEYFSSIKGAFSHVSDKWAVPIPRDAINYTLNHLAGIEIPRHVKG